MKHYLNLFNCLVKNNLVGLMEYRSNFLLSAIIAFFWVWLQLWVVEIFFGYTNSIAGWTKAEVYLLIGLFRFSKGFFDMFMRRNLFHLPEEISTGGLDYTLTKPVNSLFFMSFRYHILSEAATFLTGGAILIYAIFLNKIDLNLWSIFQIIVLTLCGVVTYYSVFTAFVTIAFFSTRLTAISSFQEVVSQIARYPSEIFTKNNLLFNIILIPIFITFTLPAQILLGKQPPLYFFIEVIFTVLLLYLTKIWWNFALKRYSSASS